MTIIPPPTVPAIIALPPCPARTRRKEGLASSNLKCHSNIAKAVGHTCWRCWCWPFPFHLPSIHNHHGSYLKLSPSLHHSPTGPARKQNTPPRVVHLVVDNVLGGEALPRNIHGSWGEGSNNHPLHLTCSDHQWRTLELSWWTFTSTVCSTHQWIGWFHSNVVVVPLQLKCRGLQ